MLQDDIIGRLILDLAEIEDRISGYNDKRDFDLALREVDTAWERLLDVPHEIAERVDGATLAQLVGEPRKMRVASQLLAIEAKTWAWRGDATRAAACNDRALALAAKADEIENKKR